MSRSTKLPSPKNETRKLCDVHAHPRQAELFGDIADPELEELAESIRINGLKHPIEILPNGMIIAGHQRVRAFTLLDREEIPVVVRHDLAESGDEAVERALISDNVDRRQMSPLGLARCYRELRKLEKKSKPLDPQITEELRDRIGKRLGKSGRSLDRLLRVLAAPLSVQRAFEAGQLPLTVADKVAGLGAAAQAEISRRIEAGERPTAVVRDHIGKAAGRHSMIENAVKGLARSLSFARRDLADRLDEVPRLTADKEFVALLEDGRRLIDQVIKRIKPR